MASPGGSSLAGKSDMGKSSLHLPGGQYFSDEQVAIFEAVYAECPSPSASQRQQIKCDNHPLLQDVEDAQIQAWFQNRRSHDQNQRKDNYRLQLARERLIADKNLLMEENVKLKKKVIELLHENDALHRNCRMHYAKNL